MARSISTQSATTLRDDLARAIARYALRTDAVPLGAVAAFGIVDHNLKRAIEHGWTLADVDADTENRALAFIYTGKDR